MAAAGAMGAAGATLLSPFPGEGRPGVKVDLRARAAQCRERPSVYYVVLPHLELPNYMHTEPERECAHQNQCQSKL